MSRPLSQHGVGDLEALFAKSKADAQVLRQLEDELKHRQTPRAVALLDKVRATLRGAQTPGYVVPQFVRPVQAQLIETEPSPATPAPAVPRPAAQQPAARVAAAPETAENVAKARRETELQPVIPLQDAYKLLKVSPASPWEAIEQSRRQLVAASHPARLQSLGAERRAQVRNDAVRINAACAAIWRARSSSR